MKGKPLIPFAVIAVLGIFLMVTMSLMGQGERAALLEGDDVEEIEEFDDPIAAGEEIVTGSCLGCHGNNLEGAMGPALTSLEGSLTEEEIANIVLKGQGDMPAIDVNEVEADAIAQYLLSISQ